MADNPVTFPRRFFPAQIAPQREIGSGVDLTLRLRREVAPSTCDQLVQWVGEFTCLQYEAMPASYRVDGLAFDFPTTETLQGMVGDTWSNSTYYVFAAVSGVTEDITWEATIQSPGGEPQDFVWNLKPMGVACAVLWRESDCPATIILTYSLVEEGEPIASLTLEIATNSDYALSGP